MPDLEIDALLLLQSVSGISRAQYYARGDEEFDQADRYLEKVKQRAQRVPLQQITGEQYFCGLRFQVNENVLCPRPETELLVEEALKRSAAGDHFLDLCTGSGCIAVSLLCLGPDLTGHGCDLSQEALRVAAMNAELNHVSDRLKLTEGDLYEAVPAGAVYDLIVSNPPYIASGEIGSLMPEVRDHEPHMALDGGEDGLVFYRRILEGSGAYLKKGGWLIVEIGYDQGEAVSSMFIDNQYQSVQVIRDLAGMDRVVLGQRSM